MWEFIEFIIGAIVSIVFLFLIVVTIIGVIVGVIQFLIKLFTKKHYSDEELKQIAKTVIDGAKFYLILGSVIVFALLLLALKNSLH